MMRGVEREEEGRREEGRRERGEEGSGGERRGEEGRGRERSGGVRGRSKASCLTEDLVTWQYMYHPTKLQLCIPATPAAAPLETKSLLSLELELEEECVRGKCVRGDCEGGSGL